MTSSKTKTSRPLLSGLIIALLLLLASPSVRAEPEIGRPAPALTAQELNGTAFDLAAMRGKVVILHFWATWCPSCREEMAVLDKFNKHYHDQGVEVVAISLDKPRNRKEVEATMQPFSFPSALMTDVTENGFGSPNSVPVTWIIDKNGVLRARMTPEEQILSEKLLENAVGRLLEANNFK